MKKEYLVRWEIDVDADSAEEAVELASAMLHGKDSTASVFEVFTPDGKTKLAMIDAATMYEENP